TDLKMLITEAAEAGADMIGLNPLHALRSPVEQNCSPYSPSDRRFLNPLYIDPEIEPEYLKKTADILPMLVRLRAQDKVPYAAVHSIKMAVFREMYTVFSANELEKNSTRAQKFQQFVRESGESLQDFCLYQVLAETTGEQIDQLDDKHKREALNRYAERIQFHAYLQWLADGQLDACQRHSRTCGMQLGLMRDLAVGADGG